MAQSDQEKWDRKYLENPKLREERPPVRWIERFVPDREGYALDLACGTGRNAVALARRGWRIKAVDLSPVALQILTEFAEAAGVLERIDTELIDLDVFVPEKQFDLILKTNYLDRDLIRRTIPSLKSGGLYIVETYMEHEGNEKKDSNPDYLLKPGELRGIFSEGFEILHYEEFWNEGYEMYRMRKQAIVARKTA
jgi:SAM-dependent methyltransferase